MLHNIWDFLLYKPLVNALALLISVVPGGDLGIAIILLTIIVKLLLYPLSQRSIHSQAAMNALTPELNRIKQSGASKEEQARLTFELYRHHKTNPFSGCLLVLIQIPIILALYYVFFKGISFNPGLMYSFVHIPEKMNTIFLGIIDISSQSLFLGILAGVSQYFQTHFMPQPVSSKENAGTFSDSFSKSMHMQMKYVFPFLIFFITWKSGVIALYFITSNIFAIGQQLYAKRNEPKIKEVSPPK